VASIDLAGVCEFQFSEKIYFRIQGQMENSCFLEVDNAAFIPFFLRNEYFNINALPLDCSTSCDVDLDGM
jgi:hypothetical protein